jgi:hypothetical protein
MAYLLVPSSCYFLLPLSLVISPLSLSLSLSSSFLLSPLCCLFVRRGAWEFLDLRAEIVGVVGLVTGRASQQANKSAAENVNLSAGGNVCRYGLWNVD